MRRDAAKNLSLSRDQVLDYHRRKGLELREVERWLNPNRKYDRPPG